jgi:hypothetical protein
MDHDSVGEATEIGTCHIDGNTLVLNDSESGERFAFRSSLYRGILKLTRDETRSPVMQPWHAG